MWQNLPFASRSSHLPPGPATSVWSALVVSGWLLASIGGCRTASAHPPVGHRAATPARKQVPRIGVARPVVFDESDRSQQQDQTSPPFVGPWEHEFGNWSPADAACSVACETPLCFDDDWRSFPRRVWDDAAGTANWSNGLLMAGAAAAAIGMRQDLDGEVREAVARHPMRWGEGTRALGLLAEPQYQVPVLLGVYAYSLRAQDAELHGFSRTLISAFTINGLATLAVKGIANTDRPSDDWNGGQFGFPSYHTSSSFCMAAVVDEYYGLRAALPAYALAGLIGWSRIDEQDHDLSDVVFGAALGYVLGKSVARRDLFGDGRVRVWPFVHPAEGAGGVMFEVPF